MTTNPHPTTPKDWDSLIHYCCDKYPEALDLDINEVANAIARVTKLGYSRYETVEIALSLLGIQTERKPNRQERRLIHQPLPPSTPTRTLHHVPDLDREPDNAEQLPAPREG